MPKYYMRHCIVKKLSLLKFSFSIVNIVFSYDLHQYNKKIVRYNVFIHSLQKYHPNIVDDTNSRVNYGTK